MPIYLMFIRVLLSVEFCFTLKTYLKGAPFYNALQTASHETSCVADGVTRNIVCLFREPDAGNLPVRFDEREQETEPSQTGLRWRGESHVEYPPGDYSHCAC